MENDPIAAAIATTAQAFATALQEALTRGLELTPTATGGFLVRIAPADGSAPSAGVFPDMETRGW